MQGGYGGTILDLSKYFINSYIYGITLTDTQIKYTQNIINNNNIKNANVCYGNFNENNYSIDNGDLKYDIIYFIESICHSNCKETTIKIALSMLNNNGKLIIFDYFENLDNNLDKDILDILTLDEIKVGMALPSFINIQNVANITDKFKIYNVNKHILPGMKYSKIKAQKKLNNDNIQNINIIKHLKSCIDMYDLHSKHILNYNIVVIDK